MIANRSRRSLFIRLGTFLLLVLFGALVLGGMTGRLPALFQSSITLTWTTENEIDVGGYNILRADSENGPFEQINDEMIPPAADPFVSSEKRYVDERDIRRGETYYYMLETVDRYGNARQEGPIALTAR